MPSLATALSLLQITHIVAKRGPGDQSPTHCEAALTHTPPVALARALFVGLKLTGPVYHQSLLQICQHAADRVLYWCSIGFPNAIERRRRLQCVATILEAWLVPRAGKRSRESRELWCLFASTMMALGLEALAQLQDKRQAYRVILRAMPSHVQRCLLHRQFASIEWFSYIARLYRTIWMPSTVRASCVYVMASTLHTVVYLVRWKS